LVADASADGRQAVVDDGLLCGRISHPKSATTTVVLVHYGSIVAVSVCLDWVAVSARLVLADRWTRRR
jgi:hypothetical protein